MKRRRSTKGIAPAACRRTAMPCIVAMEFVTTERTLISAMIAEFMGRRQDSEDLRQELWIHLQACLKRRMPIMRRRRAAMIAMTRNFLKNQRRSEARLKRRPRMMPRISDVDVAASDAAHDALCWQLDMASLAERIPPCHGSLLLLLVTLSVPEASEALSISASTAYRWRRLIRQRLCCRVEFAT